MNDKEKQEVSIIGRLFSMEALLFLMGCISLGSGFYTGEPTQYFWGVMIVGGAIVLHFVRKKDWKKHWEEQERLQELRKEQQRRSEEKHDGD
jgi:flagellar biosynthesis component FlhA